jgi:hypothetical protein
MSKKLFASVEDQIPVVLLDSNSTDFIAERRISLEGDKEYCVRTWEEMVVVHMKLLSWSLCYSGMWRLVAGLLVPSEMYM